MFFTIHKRSTQCHFEKSRPRARLSRRRPRALRLQPPLSEPPLEQARDLDVPSDARVQITSSTRNPQGQNEHAHVDDKGRLTLGRRPRR